MAAAAAAANAAHIAQMQMQIDQLIAQVAAAPAAPAVAAAAVPVLAPDAAHNAQLLAFLRRQAAGPAPSFNGKAVGLEARRWLTSMQRYFDVAGVAGDADRLMLVGTLLTGPAQTWWASELARPLAEAARIATWPQFEAALRARFEPVDAMQWGRAQLLALTRKSLSVVDYTERFLELIALVTDMAENDRIFQYKIGLPSSINAAMAGRAHTTLQAATEEAIRRDSNRAAAASSSQPSPNSGGGTFSSSSSSRFSNRHFNRASGGASLNHTEASDERQEQEADGALTDGAPDALSTIMQTMLHMEARLNALSSGGSRGGRSSGRGARGAPGGSTGALNPGPTPGLSNELAHDRFTKGLCVRCGQPGHRKSSCTNAAKIN